MKMVIISLAQNRTFLGKNHADCVNVQPIFDQCNVSDREVLYVFYTKNG